MRVLPCCVDALLPDESSLMRGAGPRIPARALAAARDALQRIA